MEDCEKGFLALVGKTWEMGGYVGRMFSLGEILPAAIVSARFPNPSNNTRYDEATFYLIVLWDYLNQKLSASHKTRDATSWQETRTEIFQQLSRGSLGNDRFSKGLG